MQIKDLINSCIFPAGSHAKIVISNKIEGKELWKLEVVKELCTLEKTLEPFYSDICEIQQPGKCCRAWSLTNYLLLVANKTNCEDITVFNCFSFWPLEYRICTFLSGA